MCVGGRGDEKCPFNFAVEPKMALKRVTHVPLKLITL